MGKSSLSSSSGASFSSLSSDDDGSRRTKHRRRRRSHHRDKKRHKNYDKVRDGDAGCGVASRSLPAAPSDYDELRAHYQFVLPTENDDNAIDNFTSNDDDQQRYGSTWQQRMVRHYHSHLYKEYVLADLSRVFDLGKVGLRWRTEREVANGRGFRCCGNLKCEGTVVDVVNNNSVAKDDEKDDGSREEYNAAARRYMGIGVPENGGKEPLGVILPRSGAKEEDDGVNDGALDEYLQSCARERRRMQQQQQSSNDEQHSDRHRRKSKQKRQHKHCSRDGTKYHSRDNQQCTLKEQERREQKRLSRLPFGMGLHDYEVDFVYVEQGIRKRELVKVRLCLRCAPLLFVAKMSDEMKGGGSGGGEGKAPAVKAREAREKAARSHALTASTAVAGIPYSLDDKP